MNIQNLETKRLITEKKDAVAAQYAAEATLRRVYANQKDDDSLTFASVVAPLEAEIKMYKNEVSHGTYQELYMSFHIAKMFTYLCLSGCITARGQESFGASHKIKGSGAA